MVKLNDYNHDTLMHESGHLLQDYLAEQLKAYRSGKRSNEIMSVVAKPLTDAEIADLSAWFASIAIEAKPPK